MRPIKMVDLHGQYLNIKTDIDDAIQQVLNTTDFIQGSQVKQFENALSQFLDCGNVVACGNGTDALQIAFMALECNPGDEIILPVFTYVSTAEVIALLRLVPVFADVDSDTFNLDVKQVEKLITKRTKAIVPVHLYGQCANLEPLIALAAEHKLNIVEDAAQSLGAEYIFSNGLKKKAGTVGIIGTTSFFPSKNLGAFGDAGALLTNNESMADKIRVIANHGQKRKYYHDVVGVNSRMDTLQAAILQVKLRHLDEYCARRQAVADYYDRNLRHVPFVKTPVRSKYSTHVFHQYTLQVEGGKRDALKAELSAKKIPSMIYYPIPLHLQQAYKKEKFGPGSFPVSEDLSAKVLSLPIHTEMDEEQLSYICDAIQKFSS
jgi:UDP-2-acetamido-2-deoxy-ribo-hexuluronate aminotransferase